VRDVMRPTRLAAHPTDLVTIDEYNLSEAAEQFHAISASSCRTALVVGEYEAAWIRQILKKNYQYEVVDLAAKSGAKAPRYQLAIATSERDTGWNAMLSDAMQELFKNFGSLMGKLYGQYMVDVIREAMAIEGDLGQDPYHIFDALTDVDDKQRPARSYLQLHDMGFPVSTAFKDSLRDYLGEEISRLQWLKPGSKIEPVLYRLVPWLDSDEEKILQKVSKTLDLVNTLSKTAGDIKTSQDALTKTAADIKTSQERVECAISKRGDIHEVESASIHDTRIGQR